MGLPVVDRLIAEIIDEVEALPGIARRSIAPVLVQARRETAQGLANWLSTAKDAEERFTAHQYRRVLVQLDQALDTVATLEPAALNGLALADRRAGPLAVHHIERELQTFGQHFEGSFQPILLRESMVLQEGNRALMTRFQSSAARYAGAVGVDIRQELAVGMLKGESIGQLAHRLSRHGGSRGDVSLKDIAGSENAVAEHIAEGLFTRYDHWGERLARTELVNAYNVHAEEGIREAHEIDARIERMWSAAFDRRACPECMYLDGKTAPIGGQFPGGYEAPPAHPYCRCAVVAWRADWN